MATRCKPKTTHLENFSSIPKRVGGVVVVVEAENDNMHSDWIDQVSISKNQRGNFAVFGKKHVGSNKPPFRRRWVTWDKVIGIKSPLGLITGLKQVAESLGV